MNFKKETSNAVIFLAAFIIFLSSITLSNNVFAQTEGEEDSTSTSTNYENFQNCLSDASGQYNTPSGDQIVNCFVGSGYVQGSSSTSNTADMEDGSENTQVNVADDGSDDDQTENVQVNVADDGSDDDGSDDDGSDDDGSDDNGSDDNGSDDNGSDDKDRSDDKE